MEQLLSIVNYSPESAAVREQSIQLIVCLTSTPRELVLPLLRCNVNHSSDYTRLKLTTLVLLLFHCHCYSITGAVKSPIIIPCTHFINRLRNELNLGDHRVKSRGEARTQIISNLVCRHSDCRGFELELVSPRATPTTTVWIGIPPPQRCFCCFCCCYDKQNQFVLRVQFRG